MIVKNRSSLQRVTKRSSVLGKNRVISSVSAPGDTQLSDATAYHRQTDAVASPGFVTRRGKAGKYVM